MAEIKSSDVDRFLRNLPQSYFAYLICGSDTGLVAERTRCIVKTLISNDNDPFRLVRLDGDSLAQDKSLLADEALTVGLFGCDRIVWVTAGAKNFVPSLEALIILQPPGCKLVIEAGPLKNDSALKRVCIKAHNVAVIECWPDGVREIASLIEDEMATSALSMTSDARDLLTSLLGGDRLLSRGEIEKIKTYSHGQTSITEEDILAIVADGSSSTFDQAIAAAFDGDRVGVLEIIKRVLVDFDPGTLLSLSLNHALLLHQFRLEIEGGRSVEEALERGPRFFGKKKATILRQLKLWNTDALFLQSSRLLESVKHLRHEPKLFEEIVIRSLLGVAHATPRPKA